MHSRGALFLLAVSLLIGCCAGHGYLSTPSARNHLYKLMNPDSGPAVPASELVCTNGSTPCGNPASQDCQHCLAAGGPSIAREHCAYGDTYCVAKYGMCGDAYNETQTWLETGSNYRAIANGVYAPGQVIPMIVTITAHHMGFVEFFLFDHDDSIPNEVTSWSVPNYKLELENPNVTNAWCQYWNIDPLTDFCLPNPSILTLNINYKLPAGVECNRCTIQWHYKTGNSVDAKPEEFWNCADVVISSTASTYVNNVPHVVETESGATPNKTTGWSSSGSWTPVNDTLCRTCVAVPGMGINDGWCQIVCCNSVYVNGGFCRFNSSDSSEGTGTGSSGSPPNPCDSCVATPGSVASDAWCRAVCCDEQYVAGGICMNGTSSSTGGSPPTDAPTEAPSTDGATQPPTDAPTEAPTNPPGLTCYGVPAMGTSNAWCRAANCDPVYVASGHCRWA